MILTFENYINEETKYDNIHGDSFWGNTGAGILPICVKTKRILITLRSIHVNEPHTWGIIGGKIDNDEDPKTAAFRELKEETNCKENLKLINSYIYKSPNNTFTYYNFIGLCNSEFKVDLDWETEECKWVSLDELLKIKNLHFGLQELIKYDLKTIKKYC